MMDKHNADQQITDRYVMDRYQKETGQIHAPADLIRRTKEAVRTEEQRLASKDAVHEAAEGAGRSRSKANRMAFPLTAAAALCIALLGISVIGIGGRTNKTALEKTPEMADSAAADMMAEAAEEEGVDASAVDVTADRAGEDEATNGTGVLLGKTDAAPQDAEARKEPLKKNGNTEAASGAAADAEDTAARTDETAAVSTDTADTDEVLENDYADSAYDGYFQVETMDGAPSVAGASEWEPVTVHGVDFQVMCGEDGTWCAYTEEGSGKVYVINTELTSEELSREDFLERAYELLTEKLCQ